jgi:hypothetical protein
VGDQVGARHALEAAERLLCTMASDTVVPGTDAMLAGSLRAGVRVRQRLLAAEAGR